MIYTDVFSAMFGVRGRAFAQLLSAVLGILFFGLIVWGSYEPTLHAWASGEYEGEGALRVPALPARIVVLVGAFLVVVSYVFHGIHAARAVLTGRMDDEPSSAPTQI
jgi:TRAP-type C4-dicarboxylate transport system permease small subunit